MRKISWVITAINAVALLAYFNYSIAQKNKVVNSAKLVLLQLAPVDPRSLMQGDYMQLRYAITQDTNLQKYFGTTETNKYQNSFAKRGFIVVILDSNNVATFKRFAAAATPLNNGEVAIKYTAPNGSWDIKLGAESYFFEEGKSEKYAKARYGALKVDTKGNSVLIGLYNDSLQFINK
jgi:uncharacterized membrane-anchored protein